MDISLTSPYQNWGEKLKNLWCPKPNSMPTKPNNELKKIYTTYKVLQLNLFLLIISVIKIFRNDKLWTIMRVFSYSTII